MSVLQLRTYTINKGMMDSFISLFNEHIRPVHERLGIPVQGTWVNLDRNELIWMRKFDALEDIPAKEQSFFDSPERKSLGDLPPSHIAKMEIKLIESVDA